MPPRPVVAPPSSRDWRPVVQGRLENGLRYAILPRSGNEPGVGLFMRVTGGFLAERRPGERGLAHLIEHLVFHSPTRSAPDELRRFRQIGFP
jgi:predicted Zn-dependent peptidase